MIFHLFDSRAVKQARDMHKHVRRLLNAQRDILAPAAVANVEAAMLDLTKLLEQKPGDDAVKKQMSVLETAANKWLKPYPNAAIRENVEVLLVALAVAMGIRTFFLQPFKIPTGSMQPTLFGVTTTNLRNRADVAIPNPLIRIWDATVFGRFYHDAVAEADGQVVSVSPGEHILWFINTATVVVQYNDRSGSTPIRIWFTPEETPEEHFDYYANIGRGMPFHKGDDIVKFEDTSGDHLFVDRVSYNFRHPMRGEIIVFETRGIGNQFKTLPPDEFYIKRLVALGGERVQIGNDRHLVIDGKRLDKSTPHFENVYSFDPNQPPRESQFSGHVGPEFQPYGPELAPLFADSPDGAYTVRPDHYMVMGDNTLNSLDSRAWGDFTRTNVTGKYLFVYWPFSSRFGWSVR